MPDAEFAVQRLQDLSADELQRRLTRSSSSIFNDRMRDYAREVLDDVARDGDEAVVAYTSRWDNVTLRPDDLVLSVEAVAGAYRAVAADLRQAIEAAILHVRRYNEWLRPPALALEEITPGVTVGIRHSACRSAGLYVPSGKGTFPSTLITMGTPAVVAGVEQLTVVVPPRSDGSVDPAVLVAADLLGIRRVVCANGAAGIAALAVGTRRIPKADLVVGPGNPVIAAVQMAAAAYGTRPLVTMGPTESIVLADDGADPDRVALDLLNEAEHGADSAVLLLTTCYDLAARVAGRLRVYLDRLPEPRRTYARSALGDLGGLFVVADLEEGIAWIDRYAPEHLQLAVRDPLSVAARIRHAGEILAGQHTPFSVANYAIGVPAALPTGGAGFAASGITVLSFLKSTSVAALSADGLRSLGPLAVRLGQHEGFPAHVLAVTAREEVRS
jgi:histidinol dehydrogenase